MAGLERASNACEPAPPSLCIQRKGVRGHNDLLKVMQLMVAEHQNPVSSAQSDTP